MRRRHSMSRMMTKAWDRLSFGWCFGGGLAAAALSLALFGWRAAFVVLSAWLLSLACALVWATGGDRRRLEGAVDYAATVWCCGGGPAVSLAALAIWGWQWMVAVLVAWAVSLLWALVWAAFS